METNNKGVKNDFSPKDNNNIQNAAEILTSAMAEADKMERENKRKYGMFRLRSANESLKESIMQPDPIELYPTLIIEKEISLFFADTGIGKTVFAVQMANEIAKEHKVLYLDLELSDKQFEKRYKDENDNLYQFPDNFFRVDITPLFEMEEEDYTTYFLSSLRQLIKKTDAKIVFIDNMTKLVAGDTDSAKNAIPILNELHKMKMREGITFLIMEHNKKVDNSRPISLNDLQGSKMKVNFADAIFSIGRSHKDNYLRYIKQLKVRSADLQYSTDNVLLCEMTTLGGYLHLETKAFVSEYSQLKQSDEEERELNKETAKQLSKQGYSQRQIAKELDISVGAVNKYLK